jgi:hypothetical protein
MSKAFTRVVTWISRGRRRHASAMADIVPPQHSTMSPGDTFQPNWAAPTISWVDNNGSHTANFAFWSITGGIGGAIVTTQNTVPSVGVGNTDIVATALYISQGKGNGNDTKGVFIDAFDVNQGAFVDDDFVKVKPDTNLAAAANNDGFVPTASLEHIEAFLLIHAVPFSDWKVVVGTEAVNQENMQAAAHSSAIAFAFYQIHPPANDPCQGLQDELDHIHADLRFLRKKLLTANLSERPEIMAKIRELSLDEHVTGLALADCRRFPLG